MLFFENIALAISGLLANKMRALLTMLGIIIGIGSVIAIVTVGNSMTNSITESMQSMGAGNITVSLTQKSDSDATEGGMTLLFRPQQYKEEDLITAEMIDAYRSDFSKNIFAISLQQSLGSNTATLNQSEAPVNLVGVNAETKTVSSIEITNGRFLSDADSQKEKNVAVVSDKLCEKLFPMQDPIGRSFELQYGNKVYTFYVVGVYPYQNDGFTITASDETPTTALYIPLGTAKKMGSSADGFSSFTVVRTADTDSDMFLVQTKSFFASYYARNNSFTVTATSMESFVEQMTEMTATVSLAIAVIAGISLLVGGIGVMNIMLVSITERTREIGTRKALGATNGSIRVQFIVESVIICLIGGIIGIAVGLTLGAIGTKMLGYAASPSIGIILIAVTFSMCIGVFFGYYPANKAAKMDPIEALRYE